MATMKVLDETIVNDQKVDQQAAVASKNKR